MAALFHPIYGKHPISSKTRSADPGPHASEPTRPHRDKISTEKAEAAVGAGDEKKVALELAALSSRLDKASRRGVIHKNLANRKKSRASRKLVAAQAPKAGAA